MAVSVLFRLSPSVSTRDAPPAIGRRKLPVSVSLATRRSVEQLTSTTVVSDNWRFEKSSEADEAAKKRHHKDFSTVPSEQSGSLNDYFEHSEKLIIAADGGPPRWFTPLECRPRLENSPLLLYLPGLLGVGFGLLLHHQRLGEIFDIWCLHIPVIDRSSFPDLVKMVEETVRSENYHSPKRPIYLVGESFGGCLALAVAARNPDIDLILILANPATCISKSQLQLLFPLLEIIPEQLRLSTPFVLRLFTDVPSRMVMANVGKGLTPEQTVQEISRSVTSLSSYLSVVANALSVETLLWKLKMLQSASAYTNSRLHAVKAQILLLCSGKDQFLPSKEEGERLLHLLPQCEIRRFNDSGHALFLEDGVDLVSIIRGTYFYRQSRHLDYALDYLPPSPSEFSKIYEPYRWIEKVTSPVMLSTIDSGKIVSGLSGIPSEGPVLLVGYHMFLGIDLVPLVAHFWTERNIVLRGMAHPLMFMKLRGGRFPDSSAYDTFRNMGAVPVSPASFYKLLSSKSHVLLYPGGMREALHRKGEEYNLFWPEQSEFVRMAARFGAKIVPFGVVGEDDLVQMLFDYDDLVKIPYFKSNIEELTNEVVKLRTDGVGEVTNQHVHLPIFAPKLPGRFYYLFGKPIKTEGRKQELRSREKAHELYMEIKSEVERCIAYLKEKREADPYRNILPRLIYQATHGFESKVPTFEHMNFLRKL